MTQEDHMVMDWDLPQLTGGRYIKCSGDTTGTGDTTKMAFQNLQPLKDGVLRYLKHLAVSIPKPFQPSLHR